MTNVLNLPIRQDYQGSARKVLQTEAAAIARMAEILNDSFNEVIDLILKSRGRIIVTGMGKSGHIARKIAATFASTGQPSIFVHPAEASHGDMGMITSQDVVIALSNSGETAELADLIEYTRLYQIPLIALTRRPKSTLALHAEFAFILPDSPEACPMNLAPTTSTTMMLVFGDALAVALLEARQFTPADFK
ncbi:KpsF/GutQ family sugar-phosphate isomerase, partial [Candidatus Paracaedibacter symbiosus]|uniref:KpsF/GutQ family sugar-phosphate isomerase n=1 Tax=Candidatus Paracaedibacter symbiosus TaxID=244582 RepID=UPI0012EB246B